MSSLNDLPTGIQGRPGMARNFLLLSQLAQGAKSTTELWDCLPRHQDILLSRAFVRSLVLKLSQIQPFPYVEVVDTLKPAKAQYAQHIWGITEAGREHLLNMIKRYG